MLESLLFSLIIAFASASYYVGFVQILKGKYSPSFFSRSVWLFLQVNSFFGVILSNGSTASIILSAIVLLGNLLIAIASYWKGTKDFGKLEYFCILMLVISGVIWLVFDSPVINLGISLFAHFIGALPTYKKVWLDPKSESTSFWSLFFIASFLSVLASPGEELTAIIFPIYFVLFDGSIFLLSIRKKRIA